MAEPDRRGMLPDTLPADLVEEAILAFDAGNHAWGRYRHFVLSAHPEIQDVSTHAIREALQEAAICVPDARTGEIAPLREAIREAREGLREYDAALPPEVQRSELNEAADAFDEAVALLEGRTPEDLP